VGAVVETAARKADGEKIDISLHANSSESHNTSSAISYNFNTFNCVVDVEEEK
jgi:hypothetical protein